MLVTGLKNFLKRIWNTHLKMPISMTLCKAYLIFCRYTTLSVGYLGASKAFLQPA